jgi:hypothetical protein
MNADNSGISRAYHFCESGQKPEPKVQLKAVLGDLYFHT